MLSSGRPNPHQHQALAISVGFSAQTDDHGEARALTGQRPGPQPDPLPTKFDHIRPDMSALEEAFRRTSASVRDKPG